jgi:hypothetical protein
MEKETHREIPGLRFRTGFCLPDEFHFTVGNLIDNIGISGNETA